MDKFVINNTTAITQRTALRDCVTMIAGADLPTGWPGMPDTVDYIGVNVSEPLPRAADYYPMPTQKLNSGDTSSDAGETLEPGFANLPRDAYHDFVAPAAPARPPFDNGEQPMANAKPKGPLSYWDLDNDGTNDRLSLNDPMDPDFVVRPGTALDWSTAYLQRLADPEKPWDATFNPYITVDWMPIDLTVFNGEDNRSELDGATPRFASRQKVGQTLNAQTLAFSPSGAKGQTFLSALTDTPQTSTAVARRNNGHFQICNWLAMYQHLVTRPSSADGSGCFLNAGLLELDIRSLPLSPGLAGLPALCQLSIKVHLEILIQTST